VASANNQNNIRARESIMKLQLISSAVVVYTALAVACICFAGV